MSQARSSQWLGRFGNRGHGLSRTQLRQGLAAIRRSLTSHPFPQEHTLLRLDGHSGNGAVLTDLAGVAFVTRGKDSSLLDHPLVQARQHVPPDQLQQRPESQMVHSLSGGPPIPAEPEGVPSRVVMVAHPAGKQKSPIGVTRAGVVSERFFTNLPHHAFTACDVVAWSVHRAAFEPILSDEDQESDPDRWCSHSAWGQDAWQCVAHWVWTLRLERGHPLHPDPRRTTAYTSALPPPSPHTPASGSAPPEVGSAWKAGRFSGHDVTLHPDGTLLCPANQERRVQEQRRDGDGSRRVVSGASIRSGRPCPLREPCQWQGSVLLHPLRVGPAPLFWRDGSRREHRRASMLLTRHQRIEVSQPSPAAVQHRITDAILSRAQHAHSRLSWQERLARNARPEASFQVAIKRFGVPDSIAASLGLVTIGLRFACRERSFSRTSLLF